jgi:hypothetical protein
MFTASNETRKSDAESIWLNVLDKHHQTISDAGRIYGRRIWLLIGISIFLIGISTNTIVIDGNFTVLGITISSEQWAISYIFSLILAFLYAGLTGLSRLQTKLQWSLFEIYDKIGLPEDEIRKHSNSQTPFTYPDIFSFIVYPTKPRLTFIILPINLVTFLATSLLPLAAHSGTIWLTYHALIPILVGEQERRSWPSLRSSTSATPSFMTQGA